MDSAQVMIIGKLVLTFGILLGIPLLELWLLSREEQRRNEGRDA